MKTLLATAVACALAAPALVLAQDNPFKGLGSKMKAGTWETTMQMGPIPGMPAGMSMPPMTHTQCVTMQEIEGGGMGQKGGKLPEGCTVSNIKNSGNTVSYSMACTKEPQMTGDVTMTFAGDTYTMKQDLVMIQGGQKMPMKNTITGTYKGPCK
jgi:hypothetical protein